MWMLILGLVIFLGLHSVRIVAPEWRNARVAAMGEGPWKGVYSLISIVGFVILIWGYGIARGEAYDFYAPPAWLALVASLLMAVALICLMVSQLPSGKLKPLLKHPMLVSVKIWAFAHLLVNADAASFLLFGSFLVWAVVDRISVKRRGGALPAEGPVTYDLLAVVSGLGLWALLLWVAHEWLFGVPVM